MRNLLFHILPLWNPLPSINISVKYWVPSTWWRAGRVKERGKALFKIRYKTKPKTEKQLFLFNTSPKHLKWCVASRIVLPINSKKSTFFYKVFEYLLVIWLSLLMMAAKYRWISKKIIAKLLKKNQVFFLIAQQRE